MFKRLGSTSGMSLIEIMIVLVIMGIIATFVGRSVMTSLEKSKVQAAKIQMKNFEAALQDYYLDNNMYPTTEQGLDALISKPGSGPEPANYSPEGYLDKKQLPKDPWGRDYMYESDGSKFTIYTYGKDGKEGGSGFGEDILVEN